MTRLVLASASPRRAELLERVGLVPDEVLAADVDESLLPGERPEDYVLRVAADKAHAVSANRRDGVVLAADTSVVCDSDVLGKPSNADDALATLERLSGRSHDVLTAVVVIGPDGIEHAALARALVTMAQSSAAERDWYVATGEPLGKAGSYAIQGCGAALVERVDGDPTTVVGLPLRAALELLRAAGIRWPATHRS